MSRREEVAPSTDRTNSPTWDELDAICKGKSAMDLAEEIWRLRHCGPQDRKDAERYRKLIEHQAFIEMVCEIEHLAISYPYTKDMADRTIDRYDATRHQLVEGEVETVKDVYRKWGKDDVR